MRYMFKYSVKNRGREGNQNTWEIENLDTGEIVLTDHIELKTPVITEEKKLGKGFGMITEGILTYREHPKIGKFVVIEEEK